MTEVELKLSLPDRLAIQAQAAGLLSAEGVQRPVRKALRKEAARRLLQIASLPPEERRQVLQLVDAFIERGQLKKKVQSKQAA
jgi:hypothetical protein